MANYSVDSDLEFRRPDILDLGVANFADFHTAAADQINRYIDKAWYRQNAVERGVDPSVNKFDPNLIQDPTQLKDASVYCTLSLIYESMRKNVIEDGFGKLMDDYKERYDNEIELIINSGIDYDWSPVEVMVQRMPRTLKRA